MNRLSVERRAQVIGCLVEGMSIRATVRLTGVAKNTIVKLLADLSDAATDYMDGAFQNLDIKVVECDEIWSFCYSKQKNIPEQFKGTPGYGDVWTWTAIDADTKLIPTWLVGERTLEDGYTFLRDLKSRIKVGNRPQVTTDGLGVYATAIDALWRNGVDYAALHKQFGTPPAEDQRRYSPATCTGIDVRVIAGDPEPARISTSYVERQNLSMRMGMRRFTRLTNAFSKKIENHVHAVNLYFIHYNFARPHQTLTKRYGKPTTPAMAAGLARAPWSFTQIAELLEAPGVESRRV